MLTQRSKDHASCTKTLVTHPFVVGKAIETTQELRQAHRGAISYPLSAALRKTGFHLLHHRYTGSGYAPPKFCFWQQESKMVTDLEEGGRGGGLESQGITRCWLVSRPAMDVGRRVHVMLVAGFSLCVALGCLGLVDDQRARARPLSLESVSGMPPPKGLRGHEFSVGDCAFASALFIAWLPRRCSCCAERC